MSYVDVMLRAIMLSLLLVRSREKNLDEIIREHAERCHISPSDAEFDCQTLVEIEALHIYEDGTWVEDLAGMVYLNQEAQAAIASEAE